MVAAVHGLSTSEIICLLFALSNSELCILLSFSSQLLCTYNFFLIFLGT